jgi:hypothetical protein
MLTKTKLTLAAVLMLGLASAAQAGGQDDERGGFRVGPMGQPMSSGVNPVYHRSLREAYGYGAYGYVPRHDPTFCESAWFDSRCQ